MKDLLLDTDTISYFFRNIPSVTQTFNDKLQAGHTLNMSTVNYYEVCNGLYFRDAHRQLKQFLDFTQFCTILPLTQEIADLSAKKFAGLRKKGIIIQHTDALIAGTAIIHDLKLITNNTKHYEDITELEFENWVK
jgi:tRNA(fMet)-specific endonuclease VapC